MRQKKVFELNDQLKWVTQYWLNVGFGLICGLFAFAWKHFSAKLKRHTAEDKAMKEAILSLLDDRMGQHLAYCKNKGYTTREELRRYNRMYNAYHGLGGNGDVTFEHDQFVKLDIRVIDESDVRDGRHGKEAS